MHQLRMNGSRTAFERSLQWGEQIVKPCSNRKKRLRHHVHARAAAGVREPMFQKHQGRKRAVSAEDICARSSRRLVHRLLRSISGAPQSAHEKPDKFDFVTMRAPKMIRGRRRLLRSAVALLGNPCASASPVRHPLQHQSVGPRTGRTFRARFGVEPLSSARSWRTVRRSRKRCTKACSPMAPIRRAPRSRRYPEFTLRRAQKLGWDKDLQRRKWPSFCA